MSKSFCEGLNTGFGLLVALAIVLGTCALLFRLGCAIKTKIQERRSRARFVISNWKTYISKGYFEELALLSKYKDILEQGRWPMDLEGMFEWKTESEKAITNKFGDLEYTRNSILSLKTKYKKSKATPDATAGDACSEENNK